MSVLLLRHLLFLFITEILITITESSSNYRSPINRTSSNKNENYSPIKKYIDSARLPSHLEPIHYRLEIQPILQTFIFNGVVDIEFVCKKPTNLIYLNSKNLHYEFNSFELTLKSDPDISLSIRRWGETTKSEFLILALTDDLEIDKEYILSITFSGNLRNNSEGLYATSYKDANNRIRWIVMSKLDPVNARLVFPCFDEPHLKATFSIIIVRPNHMVALSNMDVYNSEDRENGWIADYFELTPPLSPHQLAFAIVDYRYKEILSRNGTSIRIWTQEHLVHQLTTALELAPKLVYYFESYFNTRLKLKKIDIISDFNGGAGSGSYWGLLIIDSFYLETKNKEEINPMLQPSVGLNLAQKIASLWVGGLVTCNWWNDSWIEVGLQELLSQLAMKSVRPKWQTDYIEIMDKFHGGMRKDASLLSKALSYPISMPGEIKRFFKLLIREKAAMIMKMLQFLLGKETFRIALQKLIIRFQENNYNHENFWNTLKEMAQEDNLDLDDTETLLDTWTLQPGLPVIIITRDFSQNNTKIVQARSVASYDYPRTVKMIDAQEPQWDIPLTLVTSVDPDPMNFDLHWIHTATKTFDEMWAPKHQWFLGNIMAYGFYRCNYDEENWYLLFRQFLENHNIFHPISRAQLIEDSFQLARGGIIDYSIGLNISLYLKYESNFLPWNTALENLMATLFRLRHTCYYQPFSRYIVRQIYPVYRDIAWKLLPHENPLIRQQRFAVQYSCCYLGLKHCVRSIKTKINAWLQNPKQNRIPESIMNYALKIAVKFENQQLWEDLLNVFLANQHLGNVFPSTIRDSLSNSKNTSNLQRLLDLTLTSFISPSDKLSIFENVAWQIHGTASAWYFLKSNWNNLEQLYSIDKSTRTRLLGTVIRSFQNEEEQDDFQKFLAEHEKEIDWEDIIFQRDLEVCRSNVNWNQKYKKFVIEWIKKNLPESETCH